MFGNSINLERTLLDHVSSTRQTEIVEGIQDKNYSEWVNKMLTRQRNAVEAALKHQLEKDTFHIQTYSTKRTEFPINSYVLQRYENEEHRPPHKLNTTLRGPHKVVGHYRDRDVYTTQNLVTNKLEDFKVHDLQPFYYDPEHVNPEDIAQRDLQMFEVEAINDHKGNPNYKTRMTFLVKWAGYDQQTWEPWDNLKTNAILHQYLKDHKMKRLIPQSYG